LAAILAQPERRRISPSSLEAYVACPLSWFCGYILGLAEPEAPGWDLERREEGQWVHKTLAAFFDPQEYDPGWTPKQRARRLEECLDRAEMELAASGSAGHGQVRRARREVLRAALGRVVEQEAAVLAGMRTAAVEADLGPQGQGLAVPLDSGEALTLIGRLDRLDLGDGVVQVTDYKHTSNDATLRDGAKPENLGKSAFQLPVYLASALASQGAGAGAEARGRLISTLVPGAKPGEAVYEPGHGFLSPDPRVRSDLAARDEPNLFNAIAQIWQGLQGGDFIPRPEPKTCGYCGFVHFCRARFSPLAQED
jgi:ATP-dependent helicase/DNAse subunit B